MAGKAVNHSLVLLANFGHGGRKRTSESATSHIREPLPATLKNDTANIKRKIKREYVS